MSSPTTSTPASPPLSAATRVTNTNRDPAVSPDGRLVAWSKCVLGGFRLRHLRLDAKRGRQLGRRRPAHGSGGRGGHPSGYERRRRRLRVQPKRRLRHLLAAGRRQQPEAARAGRRTRRTPTCPAASSRSRAERKLGANADLYVWDIATETLYRLTDTPEVYETLNDISLESKRDGHGRLRAARRHGSGQRRLRPHLPARARGRGRGRRRGRRRQLPDGCQPGPAGHGRGRDRRCLRFDAGEHARLRGGAGAAREQPEGRLRFPGQLPRRRNQPARSLRLRGQGERPLPHFQQPDQARRRRQDGAHRRAAGARTAAPRSPSAPTSTT